VGLLLFGYSVGDDVKLGNYNAKVRRRGTHTHSSASIDSFLFCIKNLLRIATAKHDFTTHHRTARIERKVLN
jgi:hypothetical protein